MNWKLIGLLSMTGIAMAFAGVFGLSSKIEPLIWLAIFVGYGFVIGRVVGRRNFLHAFLISMLNGVWIGIIHATFFSTYLASNPDMAANYEQLPHFAPMPVMIVVMGPVFGAVFGIISGVIAWGMGKVVKPAAA